MKQSPLLLDGTTMETLQYLPCGEDQFPSVCDVYVSGKLVFQNVFVEWMDRDLLCLYRHYKRSATGYVPDKMVAMVHSHEFMVTARKLQ